jgi:cytochrome b pre-mRNA-processing protein 3
MLERLRRIPPHRRHADALYGSAVQQARLPVFYDRMGVPDTVDGRFDMIAIHVFLVLRRLRRGDETCQATAQALFDAMFEDMDRCLRELGAGDLGVGRRVKTMAKAFYGRIAAYDLGLDGNGESLADAVQRNVFRGEADTAARAADLAAYMRDQAAALERQPVPALVGGRVAFAETVNSTAGDAP